MTSQEHQDNMAEFSITNGYTVNIQERVNTVFPESSDGIPTADISESSTFNGDERSSHIKSEPEQDGFCFVDASSVVEVEIEPALPSRSPRSDDLPVVYSRRRSRRTKKTRENSENDTSSTKEIEEKTTKEKSELVYMCTECGKKFSHKCNMTSHMRTHTGETPFECSICTKKFSHKCNLTSHMRTHTGETPFECSVCGKKFSHKCNLNTHMRIHTRETPFECPICNKKFSHKCNLLSHMRTRCASQTMSATASILEEAARIINTSMLPPPVSTSGPVTTSC